MKYKNRTLYAIYEGATWTSPNMSKLMEAIGENVSQLGKFINTSLSFENFSEKDLKKVFDIHWLNSDRKSKPADKLELYDVEIDNNSVTLSLNLWWYNIPISVKVASDSDLHEFFEWPTDLLDEIFLNEEGLGVIDYSDLVEDSVASKMICVLDSDEES